MSVFVTIRRSVSQVDYELEKAVKNWAEVAEWPVWFASNVVRWRRSRGYYWQSCGEPRAFGESR